MKFTKKELLYATGLLLTGLMLGWLLFSGSGHDSHSGAPDEDEMEQHVHEEHTDEEGNVVYTCSMHPSVRENEPGNCPICGMELIPADEAGAADTDEDEYSMVMTAASAKLAQVQTTPVIRGIPEKELDLPGRIKVDERNLTSVTAYFPGRIEDVKVDFTGAPIRKGEVMATVYSPELITAQRELLEASGQQDRNPRLYQSARQKFRLWGFTDAQVDDIVSGGEVQQALEIEAPVNGFVLSLNVADQDYVQEGSVMFEVADLSRLWLMLEAYEGDVPWIKTGDEITFNSQSNPGEHYEASVSYIDPVVDPQERTVGIRADLENADGRLKPDMLVRGSLSARMDEGKLMVPASAVLWTGSRSLVYVQDDSSEVPRYEVNEVELGERAGDYYVIEEGLDEGEEVVFYGNFRVDSEFQLADKFSMMNRDPGSGANRAGHDHGEMDMSQSADTSHQQHSDHAEQDEEHSHDEHLQQLVNHYLNTKNALADDDFEKASGDFEEFAEEVSTNDEMNQHDEHADGHEAHHTSMMSAVDEARNADDIDEFRIAFREVSEHLLAAIENQGFDGGVLFKQYCPMYEGGSSWISDNEEIENPYYGDEMHNCGETVEELNN
ncbi:MAG: efflux RND transporter periplasmic adaptor subunit [Balneolaceae bacterium]